MNNFIHRWVEARCIAALRSMPVVVVTGMRQSGKTTLVRDLSPGKGRSYRSLDDFGVLALARENPEALFSDAPVTIDEAQRLPELFLAIKRSVDAGRRKGAFLLTGSANFLLLKTVADSLAGRAVYLELMPFAPAEYATVASLPGIIDSLFLPGNDGLASWPEGRTCDWRQWLIKGGFFPSTAASSMEERDFWFSGYVQAYLERDLRQISSIDQLPDFQKIMRLAALRSGRILNQSALARDAAVSQPTCHRYLNLLETGYQICRLPVYSVNQTKSHRKAEKVFWRDCGLAAWLAGVQEPDTLLQRPDCGFWFEQALFQTFQAWAAQEPLKRKLYYWRDIGGREVDLILEKEDRIVACEIKAGSSVVPSDTANLHAFAEALGTRRNRLARSIILYTGNATRSLGDHCTALPAGCFFS